jgi:hypothetical protein
MMPPSRIDGPTLALGSFKRIQTTYVISWIEVVVFAVMTPLVKEAVFIVTRMNGHGFKEARFLISESN